MSIAHIDPKLPMRRKNPIGNFGIEAAISGGGRACWGKKSSRAGSEKCGQAPIHQ
jgi:hypothetical protein